MDISMNFGLIVTIGIAILVIITVFKTARIVPQKMAFIIERLGKYAKTLDAGFHILIPQGQLIPPVRPVASRRSPLSRGISGKPSKSWSQLTSTHLRAGQKDAKAYYHRCNYRKPDYP